MTTFNKTIATLLSGDEATASKLFSQYVVEQSTTIQRAITEGLSLDELLDGLDDDEDFGSISDPIDLNESEVNADPDEDPLAEGRTFRHTGDQDDDADAQERLERDRQRAKERDSKESVTEGRLSVDQSENGDLVIKHSATGAETPAAAPAPAPVEISMESLRESFELELATALVKLQDGMFADGSVVAGSTQTPVGDRNVDAHGMTVGAGQHVGYDAEKAPGAEQVRAANSLDRASDALEPVQKGGDPKAALNAWGADTSTKTPVPAK